MAKSFWDNIRTNVDKAIVKEPERKGLGGGPPQRGDYETPSIYQSQIDAQEHKQQQDAQGQRPPPKPTPQSPVFGSKPPEPSYVSPQQDWRGPDEDNKPKVNRPGTNQIPSGWGSLSTPRFPTTGNQPAPTPVPGAPTPMPGITQPGRPFDTTPDDQEMFVPARGACRVRQRGVRSTPTLRVR